MTSANTVIEGLGLYEVIDGVVTEQPLMGTLQEFTADSLLIQISYYAPEHHPGHGLTDVLFDLTEQVVCKRRPDEAIVSGQRWLLNKTVPEMDGFTYVPKLAFEVAPANNSWDEIRRKTREYFRPGVERVWLFSTNASEAHIFHSQVDVAVLAERNSLSDPLLPGFSLPFSESFVLSAQGAEN